MYIRDVELNHIADYGFHPCVTLSIEDCTADDLYKIRSLTRSGWSIQIVDKSSLFGRGSNSTDDLKVTKVIYHNPATIVFWSDGTKTVVKCGKDDTYDKEKGFYIACAKKLFGNDYKAVGRMNKALEMAITQTKLERMTMDDVLLPEEDKNGRYF